MLAVKPTEVMTMERKRILAYYGHIRRHETTQKLIVGGKIEGKRGRGWKKTYWLLVGQHCCVPW